MRCIKNILKNKIVLLYLPIIIYIIFYLLFKLVSTNPAGMFGSITTFIFAILAFSFMIVFNYIIFAFERIAEATSKKRRLF